MPLIDVPVKKKKKGGYTPSGKIRTYCEECHLSAKWEHGDKLCYWCFKEENPNAVKRIMDSRRGSLNHAARSSVDHSK